MTEFDFSVGSQFSLWVLVLSTLVLVGTAVLFYWRVAGMIRKRAFAFLIALRLLAVLMLLLLFLEPVLSYQRRFVDRASVVLLVDTSKSMRLTDPPSPQRLSRVKEELNGPGGLIETLSADFDVRVYRFDSSATLLEGPEQVADLEATGEATNLCKAVRTVMGAENLRDLAGIVLFSDGIHNAAGDAVEELDSVTKPLYLVGVGLVKSAESPYHEDDKDVLITDVKTRPERFLTVNNKAMVDVYLRSSGFPPVERTVVLTERDGQEKGRATVVLESKEDVQRTVIEILPTRVGKFIYDVSVPVDPQEIDRENNKQSITVHVVDPKIRVLYVDKPRPEYKQLLRTLQRDPNVTLLTLVNYRAGSFTQGGDIRDVKFTGFPQTAEQLATFDVIILGSVKRVYFSAKQLDAIREFVRGGKGFVMLGGTESFGIGGYGGTALDDIMPVECGGPEIGQKRDPFLPKLTADGKTHPIFAGCERFFEGGVASSTQALELQGFNRVARVMPGATVLATSRENGDAPVVIVRNFGKGRTTAFTSTGTHRWYRLTKPLGEDSPYVRFWGQLVRWLSAREAKERAVTAGITATIDKDYYEPGEKVLVVAHVRDKDGLATDRAEVVVSVTSTAGQLVRRQLPYHADSGSYVDQVEPPAPGEYEAKFVATLDGETVGEVEETFIVGRPSLELERRKPNKELLRSIAESNASSRKYFELSGVTAVVDELQPFNRRRTDPRQWKLTPATSSLVFGLFVALLSAEWSLRKHWQLL